MRRRQIAGEFLTPTGALAQVFKSLRGLHDSKLITVRTPYYKPRAPERSQVHADACTRPTSENREKKEKNITLFPPPWRGPATTSINIAQSLAIIKILPLTEKVPRK